MTTLSVLSYTLGILAVVAFGLGACLFQVHREIKQGGTDSPDFFLTARRSVSMFTISWSFYAGAMGSWALFGPPSYGLVAGPLGIIMYSISCGLPILIVAFLGGIIHQLVPTVISMADYVRRRFGLVVSLYVSALMVFNMGVAITAEYTAVGDLFEYIVMAERLPIVIVVGVVTMIYTAWGGLYVSIITDQWQAFLSIVFVFILFIFVCVTFDAELGPLPEQLQFDNYYGYSSILVMPLSLISSTLFSEAMWQRCWATVDFKSLTLGAAMGAVAVTSVVFLLGFGGLLAAWGNVWVPAGPDDYGNTILFSLFNGHTGMLVVAVMLSVVMSESAVDSLQNAIVDTIAAAAIGVATFVRGESDNTGKGAKDTPFHQAFEKHGIWYIRVAVVVLNIPPIVVSLMGYNVLQLFLLANLITTASFVPILSGVIQGDWTRKTITPWSVMFGCACGLLSLFGWAVRSKTKLDISYSDAVYQTFLTAYDWPPFLIGLGSSIGGMVLGACVEGLVRMVTGLKYPMYELADENDVKDIMELALGEEEEMEKPVNSYEADKGLVSN